jgi:hypothetical protein
MNKGGPAFPFGTAYSGMTLRDYFAAKALQAIVQCPESSSNPAVLAMDAYILADAMLKAREQ